MDFSKAKNAYPRLKDRLIKKETRARSAELLVEIADHAGMKILLEGIAEEINTINTKLMTREKLETHEREMLMVDKERLEWFMQIFPNQQEIIDKIEKYLNSL